jgi:hypothetical protein
MHLLRTCSIFLAAAVGCGTSVVVESSGSTGSGGAGNTDSTTSAGGAGGCVPATCAALGIECGAAPDGCGTVIECGGCPECSICGGGGTPGVCGGAECCPATCAQQGIQCGQAGDGCGGLLDCGACPPGLGCSNGMCEGCVPKSCAVQGLDCGPAGDGCGGVIDCGTCLCPYICGYAGQPGVCAAPECTPTTCAQQGIQCGLIADGCGGDGCGGGVLQCGTCPAGQTCGGGGMPGKCGACTDTCAHSVDCGPAAPLCLHDGVTGCNTCVGNCGGLMCQGFNTCVNDAVCVPPAKCVCNSAGCTICAFGL